MKNSNATKAGRGNPQGYPLTWRKRRLKTVEQVRQYVADLVNRCEAGEVEDTKAARLGNLANIIVGMIERGDFEKRLEALEAKENER